MVGYGCNVKSREKKEIAEKFLVLENCSTYQHDLFGMGKVIPLTNFFASKLKFYTFPPVY